MVGLDHHGRIGQGGFFDFDFDCGIAGGVGDGLGIERRGVGAGKAKREAGAGDGRAASVTRSCMVRLRSAWTESAFSHCTSSCLMPARASVSAGRGRLQLAFADRFEDEAMLVAQQLLFLRVGLKSGCWAEAA